MKSHEYISMTNRIVYFVFAVLFVYFASRVITGSFLWYDEAGQFYIAKGLSHYSDPFSPYGGIKEVLFYNRYFNKDPGGFSVLLHFWSMISNHYIWLRILPLLFYIGTLIISYLLCQYEFRSPILSALLTSIFVLHPVFAIEACEIRAYSMEMMGTLLGLYLLMKYDKKWSYESLLILSLVLSVFIFSRYSFAIYAFAISIYILYVLIKEKGIKGSLLLMFPYAIILIISALIVYYISFRCQFSEQGQTYVAKGYLGRNVKALLSLTCFRFYVLMIIAYYSSHKYKKIDNYVLLSVFASISFIVFSAFNLYPLDERRSMSLTVIQYFSIGLFVLKEVKDKYDLHIVKIGFIFVAISLFFIFPLLNKGRAEQDEKYEDFKRVISTINKGEKIYVHRYIAPGIRYSIEEGELTSLDRLVYKNQIYLAKDKPHAPCKYLKYDIVKPEEYNADYYILQELPPLFHIDKNIFSTYKDYHHVYIRKNK